MNCFCARKPKTPIRRRSKKKYPVDKAKGTAKKYDEL